MNSFANKTAILIDRIPKRLYWEGYPVHYKIDVYRNILIGFETYCN